EAVMRTRAATPLIMAPIVPDRLGQVNERASDDTRLPERGDLRLAHAEEAREHLVGVLSQGRARGAPPAPRGGEPGGDPPRTRPGVAESRGMTAGCGSGPTSDGTSMMVSRSR